jgi:high frequency lysogenization protein
MESLIDRQNRILALAGVAQAAAMVKQLAWKGTVNQEELETCIYSLFQIDAPSVTAVYGERKKLATGLQALINLLSDKAPKDAEVARFTISLLHLERQLIKHEKMLMQIKRGIERAKIQATHFNNTHENVIANLAGLYTDTLSTLKFRIHVGGESTYLSNHHTINKVRTILLAGIRSAVLWRQMGGSRWQLMFGKKGVMQDAQNMLKAIQAELTTA